MVQHVLMRSIHFPVLALLVLLVCCVKLMSTNALPILVATVQVAATP
jgi:hypothetical protein